MNKNVEIVQFLQQLYAEKGSLHYGENVTQIEHAMQCWMLAKQSNSSLDLRVAAFLHDVGHLYHSAKEDLEIDLKHEIIGENLLKKLGFNIKITTLVSSHVWAKRYLVSREPEYAKRLSDASIKSLMNQGGLMDDTELLQCEQKEYFSDCIQLRRWDDEGKIDLMESEISPDVWKDITSVLQESSNN